MENKIPPVVYAEPIKIEIHNNQSNNLNHIDAPIMVKKQGECSCCCWLISLCGICCVIFIVLTLIAFLISWLCRI